MQVLIQILRTYFDEYYYEVFRLLIKAQRLCSQVLTGRKKNQCHSLKKKVKKLPFGDVIRETKPNRESEKQKHNKRNNISYVMRLICFGENYKRKQPVPFCGFC